MTLVAFTLITIKLCKVRFSGRNHCATGHAGLPLAVLQTGALLRFRLRNRKRRAASVRDVSNIHQFRRLWSHFTAFLFMRMIVRRNHRRNQPRPSGLMTGADAAAGIAVEVFVEQHVVLKQRIDLAPRMVIENWSLAVLVGEKDAREPAAQFVGDVVQAQELSRARRTFHGEIAAVIVMESA